MPLYEYKCDKCGGTFEVIQRFSDPPVETCRFCGGPVKKVLSAPAIQFKGSGWYVTDYGKKGSFEPSKSNGKNGSSSSTSTASGSESSSTASKETSSGETKGK